MAVTGITKSAPASKPRKGPSSHLAILLSAGLVVLLGAYALGYLPQFGSLVEDAVHSSRSYDVPALNPAFYGLAGLAAFLLLLGLMRLMDTLLGSLRNTTPHSIRPFKPVEQFIEEAAAAKISPRVARESYRLLEPYCRQRMCIDLNDDLRAHLQLDEDAIRAVDAQLFTRCDRFQTATGSNRPDSIVYAPPSVITVLDLLQRVEAAPPTRADRSASRERSSDLLPPGATHVKRKSDSAQRMALHAATLHALESSSLHLDGASGVHRRSSDYNGPRRRATDKRDNPEYKGPYQRATDSKASRAPERMSGNRSNRPPASSPERKSALPIESTEPNRSDSVFTQSRATHLPETTRSGRSRD